MPSLPEHVAGRIPHSLLLSAAMFLVVILAEKAGIFENSSFSAYDRFMTMRLGIIPPVENSPVVIVAQDEESNKALGYPVPRVVWAEVMRALIDDGAQAIAMDLDLSDESVDPEQDDALGAAIEDAGNCVLAWYRMSMDRSGMREKIIQPVFRDGVRGLGNINMFVDHDGVLRSFPPVHLLAWESPYYMNRKTDEQFTLVQWDIKPGDIIRTGPGGMKRIGTVKSPGGTVMDLPIPRDLDGACLKRVNVIEGEEFHPDRNLADFIVTDSYFTLGLEAVRLYESIPGTRIGWSKTGVMDFGSHRIPLDHEGRMRVDYIGPPGSIPTVPMWKVAAGQFERGTFNGRLVMIGAVFPASKDFWLAPVSSGIDRKKSGERDMDITLSSAGTRTMSGIEVHANVAADVLAGRYIHDVPTGIAFGIFAILAAVAGFVLVHLHFNPLAHFTAAFGFIVLIWIASAAVFAGKAMWYDMLIPSMVLAGLDATAGLAFRFIHERGERRRIRKLFGRYVSDNVVSTLVANPKLAATGGRREHLTVFFSDVRGFTSMSEKMEPEEIASILNEYFSAMNTIIFKHGGTLDKYIGDAIMVIFGAPIEQEDHAMRAVRMALEMRGEISRLHEKWKASGRVPLSVGMGINSGDMIVGNLGSAISMNYTVIGDNVNLAARLEENAKAGWILISRGTMKHVSDHVRVEPLAPLKVKGKEKLLEVWNILGLKQKPEQ